MTDKTRKALERLCSVFPTDADMADAGWMADEIERACDAYDAARAALAAPSVEPPEGWMLVPKVLTHGMLIRGGEAFFDAAGPDGDDGDSLNDQDHARYIFEAMIAAAPSQGEGEG